MVQPNDRWIRYSRKAQNQEGAGRNEEEKSTSDYFYGIRPKNFPSNDHNIVTIDYWQGLWISSWPCVFSRGASRISTSGTRSSLKRTWRSSQIASKFQVDVILSMFCILSITWKNLRMTYTALNLLGKSSTKKSSPPPCMRFGQLFLRWENAVVLLCLKLSENDN